MPDDFLYSYVMAPLHENVYARGRITKSHGKLIYVHFIDEGYGKWMSPVSDPQLGSLRKQFKKSYFEICDLGKFIYCIYKFIYVFILFDIIINDFYI